MNIDAIRDFAVMNYVAEIVDILLVSYVIYKLIGLIRGTRAVQLLKGMMIIVIAWLISNYFELQTLSWLVEQAMTYGVLAILIIFQPELRRALEQLGRGKLFARSSQAEQERMTKVSQHILSAVQYMAKRRIGSLIVLERETGLNDYVETGIPVNGRLTSELLINIFIPNTPLHDGAVLVKDDQVLAAGCYLPLSENPFISKELGTRHRAALGLSEVTDSLAIVVSEETGQISVAKNGEVHRDLSGERLSEMLSHELQQSVRSPSPFWMRGKQNDG